MAALQEATRAHRAVRYWSRVFNSWAWCIVLWLSSGGALMAQTNSAGAEEQIPPLRPPRGEIPPSLWEQHGPWLVAGAVLILVLLAAGLYLLLRPKPPVPVPPGRQAREALEPLRQQPETTAVLVRVSQVVRRYFIAAFALPPGELTTTEFSRALQSNPQVGPELSRSSVEFLRQCDQRKFAPQPPAPPLGAVGQALHLLEQAEARRNELALAAGDGKT